MLLQFHIDLVQLAAMSGASTITYKRDQVEQAIARSSDIHVQADTRLTSLRADLKRLLELDRKPSVDVSLPVAAFHSGPPPGRGTDATYSDYDAFALLVGLRLLHGGLTQGRCIRFMRAIRPELQSFHADAVRADPQKLRRDLSESGRFHRLQDGYLIHDPRNMVFLIALAGERAEAFEVTSESGELVPGNICRSTTELLEHMRWASHEKHAAVVVELLNPALQLHYHLSRIPPRSRGRA